MGPTAREELVDLIQGQKLQEEDEWEVFKGSKQGIVKRAYELLEMFNGDTDQAVAACRHRTAVHENQKIVDLFSAALYRLTSDPSSVMMYLESTNFHSNVLDRSRYGFSVGLRVCQARFV